MDVFTNLFREILPNAPVCNHFLRWKQEDILRERGQVWMQNKISESAKLQNFTSAPAIKYEGVKADNRERYGVSYVRRICTMNDKSFHRTALGDKVLNDEWVLDSKTEFDLTKKTEYEKKMFKLEDEQFEVFRKRQNYRATKDLLIKMTSDIENIPRKNRKGSVFLEKLNARFHVQNIESVCGGESASIMRNLNRNFAVTAPRVRLALKKKIAECEKYRKGIAESWALRAQEFHFKSLDVQSCSFKKNDAINLSRKRLLEEAEDCKSKTQSNDYSSSPGHNIYQFNKNVLPEAMFFIVKSFTSRFDLFREHSENANMVLAFICEFFCLPDDFYFTVEQYLDGYPFKTRKIGPLHELNGTKFKQMRFERSPLYVNANWFVYFRLFHTLCHRLNTLKMHRGKEETDEQKPYDKLLDRMEKFPKRDISKDWGRELFGLSGYLSLTLNKVVTTITNLLSEICTHSPSMKCIEEFERHIRTYPVCPCAHKENYFKVCWKRDFQLVMELIGAIPQPDIEVESSGVLLPRNLRRPNSTNDPLSHGTFNCDTENPCKRILKCFHASRSENRCKIGAASCKRAPHCDTGSPSDKWPLPKKIKTSAEPSVQEARFFKWCSDWLEKNVRKNINNLP